jgi:hypothetical protein
MRKACLLALALLLSLVAMEGKVMAAGGGGECFSYWSQAGSGCDYAQSSCSGTCSWANDGGYVFWDVSGGTVTCDCQCCVSYEY